MNSRPIIIVDADAIVAQVSPNDSLHSNALDIAQKLKQQQARVLYPATAVTEAITHIQRVLSNGPTAYESALIFSEPNVEIVEINQAIISSAMKYFSPRTSKKNTLYDCIVAAISDQYQADAIFSFDSFYRSKGFKLTTEFFNT